MSVDEDEEGPKSNVKSRHISRSQDDAVCILIDIRMSNSLHSSPKNCYVIYKVYNNGGAS